MSRGRVFIWIALALVLVPVCVTAQEGTVRSILQSHRSDYGLLFFGTSLELLGQDYEEIQTAAESLSDAQVKRIYSRYKVSGVGGFLLNTVFPGFGVGSFAQRDFRTGWITVGGMLGSIAITMIGVGTGAEAVGWIGVAGLAGVITYGQIRAFTYASDYNSALMDALQH